MKNNPAKVDTTRLTPQEYISHFYSVYSVIEVKSKLLNWLVLTVKTGGEAGEYIQTNEFGEFYDELNKLITAAYRAQSERGI